MASRLPHYPKVSERTSAPLIPNITDTRLDNFYSANYASQDLGLLLDSQRTDDARHVKMTYWSAPGMDKPGFDEAIKQLAKQGQELKKGHVFGPSWSNHWVKVDITIPDEVKQGNRQVIFEFDPSSEALIFTPDGLPLHAITGGKNTERDGGGGEQEDKRIEHIIAPKAVRAGSYQIFIEVSCNGMFGVGMNNLRYTPPDMDRTFPLVKADLVVPNAALRALWTDFRILSQVARSPHNQITLLQSRALKACNDIMNTWRQPQNEKGEEDAALLGGVIQECRDIAWQVLGSLSEKDIRLLAPYKSGVQDPAMIWAIGHCHIDTAWLWRYTQTQQKVARSWTTQCDLMDRWPNHHFAASSAQQYYWLETLYPSGFDRVKAHVKGGRFHPVGGAWLEHDCMMPSGESLVRQYLYGQRYFRSRFGSYCREAWLPDTFGYASQLPQILRSAGLKYFFTQKLSWNNINVFPYSTFNWVALDGTQVLAHMTPVDSYNAQCNYDELTKAVWNNKNLSVAEEVLFLFGNGDGGGGPTPGMLEKLERLSSLAVHHGDVPSLKLGKPADFFDHLLQTTREGETLPTWRGELYLEFHRGTYTSQAHVKDGNRSMEQKLQALEYFATLASLTDSSYEYPRGDLKEMWEDTMLNQFHDVLPGTTISLVVKDVLEIYEKRTRQADRLIQEALAHLTTGDKSGRDITIIDPLRIPRTQIMSLGGAVQNVTIDTTGMGRVTPNLHSASPRAFAQGNAHVLENIDFRLTIANGRISSLIDRHLDRELILPGAGTSTGGLMIYEDYPLKYDAWDVEVYHLESGREIPFTSLEPVEDKKKASLKAVAKFGRSEIVMTISLDATDLESSSERSIICIDVQADWHERHKVLKFALPVDIHSPHATYGTQFGLIERATHRNTTIEQAKFEVNGHMLADLSEPGYGITLVSRHKYGYAVEGNTMRMSLLRAPTSPDPETDQGKHSFSLAIMPHVGRLEDGPTYDKARAFTSPVYTCPGSIKADLPRFTIQGDQSRSIILETVKRAEDEEEGRAVILRLFESLGKRSSGKLLISGLQVKSCQWVNILEEPLPEEEREAVNFDNSEDGLRVNLDLRCFEIKSLRVMVE